MGKLLVLFMYLIGIAWIAVGALLVFATELTRKKFCTRILQKANFKKLSPIPLICGVLFLMAASYSRHTIFIVLLGILALTKGIIMIVATEKMGKMAAWWLNAPKTMYKVWGVILIILGSIVLIGI